MAQALPLVAGGLGAAGAAYSAHKQSGQARDLAGRSGYPSDIEPLRSDFINQLRDYLGGGDLLGMSATSPTIESARRTLMNRIDPRSLHSRLLGQDPFDVLNRLMEKRRPVFQSNLDRELGSLNASYGKLGGLRPGASSDLHAIDTQAIGDSTARFEGEGFNIFPQLQANWNGAQSAIDALLMGVPTFEGGAQNYTLGPLSLISQFASSTPGYAPTYPTQSATGAGLSAAGAGLDSYSNWLMTQRLLDTLAKGGGGSTGASATGATGWSGNNRPPDWYGT